MTKLKYVILLIILFLPLATVGETTFFDDTNKEFIIGTLEGAQESNGGNNCKYEWDCTEWSECLALGKQKRNCINIGTCTNKTNPPEIERKCEYVKEETPKEYRLIGDNKSKELNETKKDNQNSSLENYKILIIIILFLLFAIYSIRTTYKIFNS